MRRIGVAIATVGVAAVLSSSATASPRAGRQPPNGLQGVLLQGPTQPVCRQNEPCEGPAPGVKLTFTPERRLTPSRQVTTKADGSYRILLPAGIYAVRTDRRTFGHVPSPARVKVRRGHVDHLDFRIDTGIR